MRLEVVGLEGQLRPMAAHDVLEPRAPEIGPGGGEAVVAIELHHEDATGK
jgi:hypothetical protein